MVGAALLPYGHATPYPNTDANTDAHTDAHSDTDADALPWLHAYPNTNTHTYTYTDTYARTVTVTRPDTYTRGIVQLLGGRRPRCYRQLHG